MVRDSNFNVREKTEILKIVDELAVLRGTSRSALIREGVRLLLDKEFGEKNGVGDAKKNE